MKIIITFFLLIMPSIILYSSHDCNKSEYLEQSLILILTNQTNDIKSIPLTAAKTDSKKTSNSSTITTFWINLGRGKTIVHTIPKEAYSENAFYLGNREISYDKKDSFQSALLFIKLLPDNIIKDSSPLGRVALK